MVRCRQLWHSCVTFTLQCTSITCWHDPAHLARANGLMSMNVVQTKHMHTWTGIQEIHLIQSICNEPLAIVSFQPLADRLSSCLCVKTTNDITILLRRMSVIYPSINWVGGQEVLVSGNFIPREISIQNL